MQVHARSWGHGDLASPGGRSQQESGLPAPPQPLVRSAELMSGRLGQITMMTVARQIPGELMCVAGTA